MASKKREVWLDVFKGILVLVMITTHCFCIYGQAAPLNTAAKVYVDACFVIGFSGFIFAYGYTNALVYFKMDRKTVAKKYLINFLRLIAAFYILAVIHRVVAEGKGLFECLPKILIFADIPTYADIMLPYAFLTLFVLVFFEQIKWILQRDWAVWLTVFVSLCFCAVPAQLIKYNIPGIFLGTYNFASFPVFAYFSLFMLGAYAQKKNLGTNITVLLCCCAAGVPLLLDLFYYKKDFDHLRFPVPTVSFLAGSAALLYLIYIACRGRLSNMGKLTDILVRFGVDIPAMLIISTLLLYIIKYHIFNQPWAARYEKSPMVWNFITIFVLSVCQLWIYFKPIVMAKLKKSK
ncbi:MAG: hypothetical protein IJL87_08390 [Clostridia bacterium]|nr:hypothetical protein [Clostridia bacterium]